MRRSRSSLGLLLALAAGGGAVGVGAQPPSPQAVLQQALAALQSGDETAARELLQQVVEAQPRNGLARYHLGRIDLAQGNLEAARAHLEIASQGRFPGVYSAWYLLGRTRLQQHEFGAAVEAFDAALARAPDFAPARVDRARGLLFVGRVEEGLDELRRARSLPSPTPEAAILESQLLVYLGREDEARETLATLPQTTGEGQKRWSLEAELLDRALDPDGGSLRRLEEELGADFSLPGAYWALAVARRRAGRGSSSPALLRAALALDSDNPVTLLMLRRLEPAGESVSLPPPLPQLEREMGAAFRSWNDDRPEEGARLASGLLAQRPDLVPARLLLIRDAERRGELWSALGGYEELLDRLGEIPSLTLGLARVAHAMGAHDLAACGAERTLAGAEGQGSVHYLLCAVQADRGDTEAALESCRRAVELGSDEARAWLKLGELYFEQMRISESLDAYRRAMEREPDAAEAVRSFALSTLTTEQFAALRAVLEMHAAARPENANTLYALAVMNLRDGEVERARGLFERLAEVAPDHRQVHYNLGQLYLRAGETERGQAEMERFRQLKAAEDREWERHNQAHFRRLAAREAMAAGEPGRAVALFEENVAEGTAELSDLLELARAWEATGSGREALGWLARILEADPYHREALAGLARVADALGENERAAAASQKLALLDWPCEAGSGA